MSAPTKAISSSSSASSSSRVWKIDHIAYKTWSFLPIATVCTFARVDRNWNRAINPFIKDDNTTTSTSSTVTTTTTPISKQPRSPFLHYLHDVVLPANMPSTREASALLLSCFHAARSITMEFPIITYTTTPSTSFQLFNQHLDLITGCTQLRSFSVSNAPHFHDLGVAHVIASFPLLHTLKIHACHALVDHGLKELYTLEYLTHLEISACPIHEDALEHIAKCQHLQYLSLAKCSSLSAFALKQLLASPNMSTLIELDLTSQPVTDVLSEACLHSLKRLRWLEVSHPRKSGYGGYGRSSTFSSADTKCLSQMSLNELYINNNANFAEEILKLPPCPLRDSLRVFYFSSTLTHEAALFQAIFPAARITIERIEMR